MNLELSPLPVPHEQNCLSDLMGKLVSPEQLRGQLVVIAGLGNIGSPLALLLGRSLGPLGVRLRLIDRDLVEPKNLVNQAFGETSDIGRSKVGVIAGAIRRVCPSVDCDPRHIDLEDTSFDDFADAALCLGGLDSLRARQCLINDRAWPLSVPVIDGGVGEPALGRVHVFVPGPQTACPECSWSKTHYRQLAQEYPCDPGRRAEGPPTNVPAFVGAAVASVMASECWKWLSGQRLADSIEVSFDLDSRRFHTGRLHRAAACRFGHQVLRANQIRSTVS